MIQKFLLLLLLCPMIALAQQPNENCSTAIPLSINSCDTLSNVGATTDITGIEFSPVGLTCSPHENEVWVSFQAPATPTNLQFKVKGIAHGSDGAMMQPRVTLLVGDCNAGVFQASKCEDADSGSNEAVFNIGSASLIPNFTYYAIISDWSSTASSNEGAFEVCVSEYVTPTNICDVNSVIIDPSGSLYDSGGPDGDYGSNENCVATITPNAPNQCIIVTFNSYNLQSLMDYIYVYDGPDTNAPLLQSITGVGAGLVVQAASGSVTIVFDSDGTINEAGFDLSWNVTQGECTIQGPPSIDTTAVVQDLIDALSSPQVVVSNPVLNCPNMSIGTYSSPNGNTLLESLGMGSGIILSTGEAAEARGPNDSNTTTTPDLGGTTISTGGGSDNDLQKVIDPNFTPGGTTTVSIQDACVLEFDVYAASDQLKFNYIFGSEEYPEFAPPISSDYNDVFGFFISGPGITGQYSNNSTNIALLSDGTTPVSINNVNPGSPTDPVTGDVLYVNNSDGTSLEFDGLTTVLTAKADVIPCNTYHLKLAIGDAGDFRYDSGVFIGGLNAGLPQIDVQFSINHYQGQNILVEGCSSGGDVITASFNNSNQDTFTYYIGVTGTADEATDLVQPIPDSIIVPPGTTTVTIPFEPVNDGITEGTETLNLSLYAVFNCDTVTYNNISIIILDDVDISPSQDTFYVCEGSSIELGVGGATGYTWTWPNPSELSNPNLPNPTLTPSQSGVIYVTGTVNSNPNCLDNDSAYISIISPSVTISNSDTTLCLGQSVMLQASANISNTDIIWTPASGLSCTNCNSPTATPDSTTTYTATITIGGCSRSETVTVNVNPLPLPTLINDTLICEGSSTALTSAPPSGAGLTSTVYQWSPSAGLDNPNSATPIAKPSTNTTYTLTASSPDGVCVETRTVTVNVSPADINIAGADTIYQCNTAVSAITLNASSVVVSSNEISWSSSDGQTFANGASITVNQNTGTTTYYATVNFNGCTNSDSVVVQIDSLPNLVMQVSIPSEGINVSQPDTITVCPVQGSSSFIVNNTYESSLYPSISHQWTMNNMSFSPAETNPNLATTVPLSTTTYVIESTNNACVSRDSFVMNVETPPNFLLTASQDSICVGQNVQLTVSGVPSVTWSNAGTLNDNTILNPIATPTETTTYTASVDFNGCLAGLSHTITVLERPSIQLIDNSTICTEGSVILGTGNTSPNLTYTWSPNDFTAGDGTASPTASPSATTTYSVTVSNGICDTVASVTIVIGGNLDLSISGETNICTGTTTTLNANTQGAVNWYNGAGTLVHSGASYTFTSSSPGAETFTATAFNSVCSTSQMVTVTYSETPSLTTSENSNICLGTNVQIFAQTNANSIAWSPSNEFTDPSLPSQSVSPNGTTTYYVTVGNNGCEVTDSVIISVDAMPIMATSDDITICLGESYNIGVINDNTTNYSWESSPPDPNFTNTSVGNPIVTPQETTTYTLTGKNGLCSKTEEVVVSVENINPAPSISASSTELVIGESSSLTVNNIPAGSTVTWTATNGQTAPANGANPEVSPTKTTEYTASITTPNNCSYTATITITVFKIDFEIPNAFTPNNDGDNDLFYPINGNPNRTITEFKIFDRWGELIHNNPGTGWDGKLKGKLLPADIYIYYVKVTSANGTTSIHKGDIALIR